MSIVAFGEIMLQLSPDEGRKIISSSKLALNFVGAEANVLVSLAVLNNEVEFVSKLPGNDLGEMAIRSLNGYGVSTKNVRRGGDRIGLYFTETGSSIRPSKVLYDRKGSAISAIQEGEFDWASLLQGASWYHLSGITPALSSQCAQECIKSVKEAANLGIKVSFDLNYRRTLWSNVEDAKNIFDQIIPYCDLLLGNAGVMKDLYAIDIEGDTGIDQAKNAIEQCRTLFDCNLIAFTAREHHSASRNKVAGVLRQQGRMFTSRSYDVEITDRFGTGDAFAAGLLHSLEKGWDGQKVVDFATASFALKHTIKGDQNTSSESDISSILDGNTSGYVIR